MRVFPVCVYMTLCGYIQLQGSMYIKSRTLYFKNCPWRGLRARKSNPLVGQLATGTQMAVNLLEH